MLDFKHYRPREWAALSVLVLLAIVVPLVCTLWQQPYYLNLATRVMVFGLAAIGLNLALGFGGMISLGHAMYIGVGAYSVGILSEHGVPAAWAHVGTALVVGAVLAAIVGAVCLRTSGMGFIMITLAFAQMAYFASISLKRYGGEDGLPVNVRSQIGGLDMGDDLMFYLLVLAVLGLVLLGLHRLVHSRFGMALQGSRINERRMTAMGLPVFRYRLLAYVLSAEICVVAGVLLGVVVLFVQIGALWLEAQHPCGFPAVATPAR